MLILTCLSHSLHLEPTVSSRFKSPEMARATFIKEMEVHSLIHSLRNKLLHLGAIIMQLDACRHSLIHSRIHYTPSRTLYSIQAMSRLRHPNIILFLGAVSLLAAARCFFYLIAASSGCWLAGRHVCSDVEDLDLCSNRTHLHSSLRLTAGVVSKKCPFPSPPPLPTPPYTPHPPSQTDSLTPIIVTEYAARGALDTLLSTKWTTVICRFDRQRVWGLHLSFAFQVGVVYRV
jgi:hypothetical protein